MNFTRERANITLFATRDARTFAVIAIIFRIVSLGRLGRLRAIRSLSCPAVPPQLADSFSRAGSGSSDLQTSIPSAFTGASVNNIIGANTFYANGITGQGTVTANVEAGFIWNGHETLGHVSQYVNDASAFDDPGTVGNQTSDLFDRHATWVGMTIGGRNGGSNQGGYPNGHRAGNRSQERCDLERMESATLFPSLLGSLEIRSHCPTPLTSARVT